MLTLTNICGRRLSEIAQLERAFEENPSLETARRIKHLWINWNSYGWGKHTHEGPSREETTAIIKRYASIIEAYSQNREVYAPPLAD